MIGGLSVSKYIGKFVKVIVADHHYYRSNVSASKETHFEKLITR